MEHIIRYKFQVDMVNFYWGWVMALNSITSAENISTPAASASVRSTAPSTVVDSTTSAVKAEPIKVSTVEPIDTVTLQNRVQNSTQESKTEKNSKEESKKSNLTRSISDVLFDYNSKGDLRIKFIDSRNQLVYQTPPVLFARITELMSQAQSSVDTKA